MINPKYMPDKKTIKDFVFQNITSNFNERVGMDEVEDIIEAIRILVAESVQRCLTAQGQFSILENDKQEEKASRP